MYPTLGSFAKDAKISIASDPSRDLGKPPSSVYAVEDHASVLTILKGGHKGDADWIDGVFRREDGRMFHLFVSGDGSLVVEEDVDEKHDGVNCSPLKPDEKGSLRSPGRRQLRGILDSHPVPRRLAVEKWTDCYDDDDLMHTFGMGIVVDYSMFVDNGESREMVEAFVDAVVAEANTVYMNQLNIRLVVDELHIQDTAANPDGHIWNGCSPTIREQLYDFRVWTQTRERRGLWHLLTNCHPPPGVVGVAFLGVTCNLWWNTGVTSKTWSTTWKVFAHEVGHNFDAEHSFEEGQGRTGGIMDYGDGKLNGEYQFNTKYRKTQMCQNIQRMKSFNCPFFAEAGTRSPTTSAPTSLAPTKAPTTPAPTVAPTTGAPTSLAPTQQPTAPTSAPTTAVPTASPTLSQDEKCRGVPRSWRCRNTLCSRKRCNANRLCLYDLRARRCGAKPTSAPTSPTPAPTTGAPTMPTPAPTLSTAQICRSLKSRFASVTRKNCDANELCRSYRWRGRYYCGVKPTASPTAPTASPTTAAPTSPTAAPTTAAPTMPTPAPTMSLVDVCKALRSRYARKTRIDCASNSQCRSYRRGRRWYCGVKPTARPTSVPTTAAPTQPTASPTIVESTEERASLCSKATYYKARASFASVNKVTQKRCQEAGDRPHWKCSERRVGKKIICEYVELS